jgi:tetratricopeptide (TPR) repeat protein
MQPLRGVGVAGIRRGRTERSRLYVTGLVIASGLVLAVVCAAESPAAGALAVPTGDDALPRSTMVALRTGRYADAEQQVNRLLARDPDNARLHLLNGFVYYLQFRAGERSAAALAEAGFLLARRLDPSLPTPGYWLGTLYLDLHQYEAARAEMLAATVHMPRSTDAALGLARAAYLARDVPLALWAIDTYEAASPAGVGGLASAALIYAAAGDGARARERAAQLQRADPSSSAVHLGLRVEDWLALHRRHTGSRAAADGLPTSDPLPSAPTREAPGGDAGASLPAASPGWPPAPQGRGGARARSWTDCGQSASPGQYFAPASTSGGYSSTAAGGDEMPTLPALPSPCEDVPLPRSVVLDVVLVRTEEEVGFSHGLNLLEGLNLVLGFQSSRSERRQGSEREVTGTLNTSFGLPSSGLTYSLNIFSVGGTKVDVIARPSLLAIDRLGSTFFSGQTVSVGVSSSYGSGIHDKNIGTGLSVTPTFVDDDTLLLAMRLTRSYLQPLQVSGLRESIGSSKNTVSANTLVRFGDTAILSGLHERETTTEQFGVPVLGRMPLLGSLFRQHAEDRFTKHVVVFVTPRRPVGAGSSTDAAPTGARVSGPPYVAEAVRQLAGPYTQGLAALAAGLGADGYAGAFQTGDLDLDRPAATVLIRQVLEGLR